MKLRNINSRVSFVTTCKYRRQFATTIYNNYNKTHYANYNLHLARGRTHAYMNLSITQHTQFKVDTHRVKMKLSRVAMFCKNLLMAYWILDVFIEAQPPNSIWIMSNTDQFFPDIIHRGKCASFLCLCS